MYLGRYKKGDVVLFPVVAVDNNQIPALPATAPALIVYSGTTVKASLFLTIVNRYEVTAVFHGFLQLDGAYPAGYYQAEAWWTISSNVYSQEFNFEVTAAGNREGALVAMIALERPEATYVLAETSAGRIKQFRNPRSV